MYCTLVVRLFHCAESSGFCNSYCLFTFLLLIKQTRSGRKIVSFNFFLFTCKVKWSRYRPCVAQRVGRGIALLFHDRGTRRRWVVSSTPRPHFILWKEPVPILREAGWAPGPVWTGGKSRLHRNSTPDRPVLSQSLYRLSYPAHFCLYVVTLNVYRASKV